MPNEIVFDTDYMSLLDAPASAETGSDEAFDPDAEYNRPAPPIHDGWYYGTVRNAGVKVDDKVVPFRTSQWKNETKQYHEVQVNAEIVQAANPEVNLDVVKGKKVWSQMPLRTKPDPDRGNASGISAAFKALSGSAIAGMPGPGHVKQFVELLQTEPQGWFRVQNVLRDQDEEKAAIERGEKRPKAVYGEAKIKALKGGTNAQGQFSGAADHPTTGNRCVARAYIVEFKGRDFDPTYGKGAK